MMTNGFHCFYPTSMLIFDTEKNIIQKCVKSITMYMKEFRAKIEFVDMVTLICSMLKLLRWKKIELVIQLVL